MRCEASTGRNMSGGIKGLPLVAGGRYQYEAKMGDAAAPGLFYLVFKVELQRGCSVTIGWSPAESSSRNSFNLIHLKIFDKIFICQDIYIY